MSRRMSSKFVHSSGRAVGRRRVVGASSVVAVFLGFGVGSASVASADGFDVLDPVFWSELSDPGSALWAGWGEPGAADGGFIVDAFEQFDLAVASFYHDDLYLPLYNLTQDFIAGNQQFLDLINQP
ncbi:MAG: hypothetical protein WBA79_13665, partial [Mycobacterium sp.]